MAASPSRVEACLSDRSCRPATRPAALRKNASAPAPSAMASARRAGDANDPAGGSGKERDRERSKERAVRRDPSCTASGPVEDHRLDKGTAEVPDTDRLNSERGEQAGGYGDPRTPNVAVANATIPGLPAAFR